MGEKMEKLPERKDEEPFARPIVRSEMTGASSVLREVEGHPDKIIRSRPVNPWMKAFRVEKAADAAVRVKQMFDELREVYGIVAPVDFAVGKEGFGEDALYAVADKIEGEVLVRSNLSSTEWKKTAEQYDELLASLMYYLSDKKRDRELFFWDIAKNIQYVYGARKSESQKRIYLVDVDPFLSNDFLSKEVNDALSHEAFGAGFWKGVAEYCADWEHNVVTTELALDTTLREARRAAFDFLSTLTDKERALEPYENLETFLSSRNG